MQNDLKLILQEIRQENPICLIRIGDGEIKAIQRSINTTSRGKQDVSESLSKELSRIVSSDISGYWIGLPCPEHNSEFHKQAWDIVCQDGPHFTFSDIWANDNWETVCSELPRSLKNRNVWIVCGDDQNWSRISTVSPERIINLPSANSWSHIDTLPDVISELPWNTVVLLSCGPTGRILASRWYHERTDSTFLDIGSCFDPWTRGIRHNYQKISSHEKNKVPYCSICNTKGK